jgi:hypothetical protein
MVTALSTTTSPFIDSPESPEAEIRKSWAGDTDC